MQRFFLNLVFVCTLCSGGSAFAQQTQLAINLVGSNTVYYPITDISNVVCSDTAMVIYQTGGTSVYHLLTDISSYGYTSLVTDVHEPQQQLELTAYPNPTSGETTIRYVLSQGGKVDVGIYTISGQLVQQLFSGERAGGTYTADWNPVRSEAGMSSGVYFCKVSVNNVVMVEKIVLQ